MWKKARISSQVIFFFVFLWLFVNTKSKGADELGYPVKAFIDADPLLFLLTSLASRSIEVIPYLAIVVFIVTALFGRVFCGWVCPLGTLNNLVGGLKRKSALAPTHNWFWVKYALLVFLFLSALFSLNLSGLVDPLSFLIRSFSVFLYPTFTNLTVLLSIKCASFGELYFLQGSFIGVLFLLVLGLNLVERRFWCRYLCPLGAFLGVLSRFSVLKKTVSERCNNCGLCERMCQGNPNKAECFLCGDCDDGCPQKAIHLGFKGKELPWGIDIGKRRLFGAIFGGIIAVPLFRISPTRKVAFASEKLIRPPGALEEKEFLRRCVRCGECMKVCITNGLQPTLLEAGWEGIWTPFLVPRIGYCEFRCTLCGQVCPTGAIKRLTGKEKESLKIGLAVIEKNRCLPHAYSIPCIVCEEVCPTPKKAITLETVTVKTKDGKEMEIKKPQVDPELCVGCGICEAKCPVVGSPAIYVTSAGETREREKKFLLDR